MTSRNYEKGFDGSHTFRLRLVLRLTVTLRVVVLVMIFFIQLIMHPLDLMSCKVGAELFRDYCFKQVCNIMYLRDEIL